MATRAPATGSATVTVDPTPSSSAPVSSAPSPAAETVVLRLKRRAKKKVTWKEGTVDNESLGRKSSKKCCIFHKDVPFDEDCSDDDPDGGRRSPPGDAGEGTSGGGGGCCSSSSDGHGH
ncbi:hypothetical protein EE612_022910 [Oryza sativa]|nr:hypothetical protein EE612_022910 [Oryza sativa]